VTSQQGSHSLKSVNRRVDVLHHSVDIHSVDVHTVNLSGGSERGDWQNCQFFTKNSHYFGFMETILTIARATYLPAIYFGIRRNAHRPEGKAVGQAKPESRSHECERGEWKRVREKIETDR
jgi:hypothetical protein